MRLLDHFTDGPSQKTRQDESLKGLMQTSERCYGQEIQYPIHARSLIAIDFAGIQTLTGKRRLSLNAFTTSP
jgi:hypothetical protein